MPRIETSIRPPPTSPKAMIETAIVTTVRIGVAARTPVVT